MKKTIYFLITLCLMSCGILTKKPEATQVNKIDPNYQEIEGEPVYRNVEKMPAYPGGKNKMWNDLQEKIICSDSKKVFFHSSKILTHFIVEKDGSISNVVAFGPMNDSCEKEAVNALQAMPKWTPGEHENKIVRVSYALIFFVD